MLKLNLICRKVLINLNNQDIWIYPKQYQERKKKILQKPESLDLQSCPVALKTNESPPVRKCQHFAGDLRQHTNFWDFSTLALISTELCHVWPGMLYRCGICQMFYTSQIPNVLILPEKKCKLRNVYQTIENGGCFNHIFLTNSQFFCNYLPK